MVNHDHGREVCWQNFKSRVRESHCTHSQSGSHTVPIVSQEVTLYHSQSGSHTVPTVSQEVTLCPWGGEKESKGKKITSLKTSNLRNPAPYLNVYPISFWSFWCCDNRHTNKRQTTPSEDYPLPDTSPSNFLSVLLLPELLEEIQYVFFFTKVHEPCLINWLLVFKHDGFRWKTWSTNKIVM